MDVSVIIPLYNRKHLVAYTLDSLKSEYHPGVNLEIIVIDDHSDDGSFDFVAQNYPHVKLLRNKGKGACAARNTGLHEATGTFIQYLDSDDIIGPGFYSSKIEFLINHSSFNCCYGTSRYFESNDAFSPNAIVPKRVYTRVDNNAGSLPHIINYMRGIVFIPNCSFIFKKQILIDIGGFDETLSVNQDVDLILRALINGMQLAWVQDETSVFIRIHHTDKKLGVYLGSDSKTRDVMKVRKKILDLLREKGLLTEAVSEAASAFLFDQWVKVREHNPVLANEFLAFAKEVYWPVKLQGNRIYLLIAKIFGPDKAVIIKHRIMSLLSRRQG